MVKSAATLLKSLSMVSSGSLSKYPALRLPAPSGPRFSQGSCRAVRSSSLTPKLGGQEGQFDESEGDSNLWSKWGHSSAKFSYFITYRKGSWQTLEKNLGILRTAQDCLWLPASKADRHPVLVPLFQILLDQPNHKLNSLTFRKLQFLYFYLRECWLWIWGRPGASRVLYYLNIYYHLS